MENLKVIFIDIDNTLLDFDAYVRESLKSGMIHYGLGNYSEDVYRTFTRINNRLWQDLEKDIITFDHIKAERFNIIFKELGISFDGPTFEDYFREFLNESAIPVDGAYDLLRSLHGKYIICAASNGPGFQQRHRLDIAGMTKYFDHIFVSEDLGVSKPTKEFFDKCLEVINNSADSGPIPYTGPDCCIIGDSLTADISGGRQYGMTAILFNKNNEDYSAQIKASPINNPDYVCNRLTEISKLFTGSRQNKRPDNQY